MKRRAFKRILPTPFRLANRNPCSGPKCVCATLGAHAWRPPWPPNNARMQHAGLHKNKSVVVKMLTTGVATAKCHSSLGIGWKRALTKCKGEDKQNKKKQPPGNTNYHPLPFLPTRLTSHYFSCGLRIFAFFHLQAGVGVGGKTSGEATVMQLMRITVYIVCVCVRERSTQCVRDTREKRSKRPPRVGVGLIKK